MVNVLYFDTRELLDLRIYTDLMIAYVLLFQCPSQSQSSFWSHNWHVNVRSRGTEEGYFGQIQVFESELFHPSDQQYK